MLFFDDITHPHSLSDLSPHSENFPHISSFYRCCSITRHIHHHTRKQGDTPTYFQLFMCAVYVVLCCVPFSVINGTTDINRDTEHLTEYG